MNTPGRGRLRIARRPRLPRTCQHREDGPPGACLSTHTHLPELHQSPFTLTSDLLDVGGRPLGELHASETARAGVAFELSACPYRGTRSGRPMNGSALRATGKHHRAAIALLRGWWCALRGDGWWTDGAPLDDLGVWGMTMATLSRAGWLARRGQAPTEAEATLHKVLLGVAALSWASLIVRAWLEAPPPRTTADWLAFAEASGMLVHGGSGRACAGSPVQMEAVFAVVAGVSCDQPGLWGPTHAEVAYGRAVRAVELVRAISVLRANRSGRAPVLPEDWAGHLCEGLSPDLSSAVLHRLERDDRTARTARLVQGERPPMEVVARLEAALR